MPKKTLNKLRVLAVGANPDDIELLCAGTLAKYVQQGHEVFMRYATKGEKGHFHIPPDELAATRKNEAEKAAAVIGLEVKGMGFPDLDIYYDRPTKAVFIEMIRETRPDLIITHDPNDYLADHRVTSQLVYDASFCAGLPHYKIPGGKHKAHTKLPPIFYMDTVAGADFFPTYYVDITDTFPLKKKMLGQHKSQLTWMKEHDGIDFLKFMEDMARMRGEQCGVKYAEGFRRLGVWPRLTTERLLP